MENKPKFHPNPKFKLMDPVREVLRYHHYAYRTEKTYCQWILRYIHHFGGKTHPRYLGAKDVEAFLSHLATVGKVSAYLGPTPFPFSRQFNGHLRFVPQDPVSIQIKAGRPCHEVSKKSRLVLRRHHHSKTTLAIMDLKPVQ
jgi:hypothetical protein